ncbi:MAG: type IV toxin-antitoxin system AbiEi family antitoxin [Balneolaceae bacterium]|nr:type IV toxin-antitoxin system AbiEi family antitoxin [Balneolaceae bacterium]
MSLPKDNKLMLLLNAWVPGMVGTTPWLHDLGISKQLVQKYKQSGWLTSLGRGAYIKSNEELDWQGAVYALQKQLKLDIHVGGNTALNSLGMSHYLQTNEKKIYLFSSGNLSLPKWFEKQDWGVEIESVNTSFLPEKHGIREHGYGSFPLASSVAERAVLEKIYLSHKSFELLESFQIIEGLTTIRPYLMQELLEKCSSKKVKRLFLFMAEKAQLPVMKHIKLEKIDVGTGDRSIVKNGVYDSKYGLVLPKELVEYV